MSRPPIIAHVHVPKTAGTTINAYLAAVGPGRDHVQHCLTDDDAFARVVSESHWIAGHVPLPRLCARLDDFGVPARFVTALREPTSHVASHYNWLIEIGRRGGAFLAGHPPEIQAMHHAIRTTDNTTPSAVTANLRRYAGMFLNCQTRYLVGAGDWSDAHFRDALGVFDTVVFSDDVAAGVRQVLPDARIEDRQENASGYHFDPAVFRSPEVRAFLAEANRSDHRLWHLANALCRPERASAGAA